MTRLETAVSLIWAIRRLEHCTSENVEAVARAIMELGVLEGFRSSIDYVGKTPREMESTGAPVREWM